MKWFSSLEKSVKITVIITAAVLIMFFVTLFTLENIVGGPGQTITVEGRSTLEAEPDTVTIYFDVETTADTTGLAKELNDELTQITVNALTAIGVQETDIKTQSISVHEDYVYYLEAEPDTNGYVANRRIELEFPIETYDINMIVDAGVNSGVKLSWIQFGLSDELEAELKLQAIEQATLDAKTKAEAVAKGQGVTLGDAVSATTADFYYYPQYQVDTLAIAESSAKDETVDVNPTPQDVTAGVTVVYKIK